MYVQSYMVTAWNICLVVLGGTVTIYIYVYAGIYVHIYIHTLAIYLYEIYDRVYIYPNVSTHISSVVYWLFTYKTFLVSNCLPLHHRPLRAPDTLQSSQRKNTGLSSAALRLHLTTWHFWEIFWRTSNHCSGLQKENASLTSIGLHLSQFKKSPFKSFV